MKKANLILLLMCSFSVLALELPRVDGIRWLDQNNVEITWSVVDIAAIPGRVQCTPTNNSCAAGIGVRAYLNGRGYVFSAAGGPWIYATLHEDLAQVAARFIQRYGRSGKFIRPSSTREYSNYCGSFVTASPTVSEFNGTIANWAPCVNIPVQPVSCTINVSNLNIAHGSLDIEQVHGAKSSGNFSILCNRDTHINFSLSGGGNQIRMNNNIVSTMSLNNGELATSQRILANVPTPFSLISTLSAAQPLTGDFTGVGTIYLNYL